MFRRHHPALIASLATAAATGLVAPAMAAGVLIQRASSASLGAAAGVVAPAVAARAVVGEAATTYATAAGEAPPAAAVDVAAATPIVEEQVTEPAPAPVEEPATVPTPDQAPAGEPTPEPIPTTTTTPTTTTPTTTTTTTTPTTTPVGEPAEPAAEPPIPATTTPAPADEPACEPTTDTTGPTTTAPAPADEPPCEPTTEPPTTAVPDEETEPPTTAVPDEEPAEPPTTAVPDEEPAEPPTTAAPDEETEPPTPTTVAPDEEPADNDTLDPTVPATVPTPADEPVEGADSDDGASIPSTGDEPPDVATARAPAQRANNADVVEAPEAVDQPDAPVPTPIDTTPAELNTYDPGLRASSYDGVYAEGVPVGVAMATTRWLESGNRYDARARGSTASGAYQILDSTWNGYAGYARAVLAPPEVQDQFAYESFTALLKRHGNDVSTIPVSWYIGHVPRGAEWDTVPHPEAGNRLTPRQYQAKWMKRFFSLLSEGAPVYLPSDTESLIPAIAFPVLGPVEFVDDWHFERDGGARRHEGLDMLGYEGQPLRAAFDGVITRIDDVPSGIAGNGLRLTRDDGLYANYFHLSNSETGPVHSSLEVGSRVRAGQIIGFMGSTGNAGIPHLHFELRTAEREPMAPYPAMLEAVQREQCTVGLGPWSTEFTSPVEQAEAVAATVEVFADLTDEQVAGLLDLTDAEAAAVDAFADLTDEQVEHLLDLTEAGAAAVEAFADLTDEQVQRLFDLADLAADEVEYLTIEGPDGAQWVIGSDGSVTASGQAAMVGTYQTDCPMPIDTTDQDGDPIMYGTDADGLPVDELPIGWWDDEAIEWTPDLDDDEDYVDPWDLDQAELEVANENHVDQVERDDQLADRRSFGMI